MIRIPLPIRVVTKGRITLGPVPDSAAPEAARRSDPEPEPDAPPLPERGPGNGEWRR
jgi:hypothetical protein